MASPHNTHDADLMRMMNRDNYLMFSCCETDGGGGAFQRDNYTNNMNEDDDDGCDDEVREFITSDEFLRAITDADVLDAEAALATTTRTTATAAAAISSTRQQPDPEEEEPIRFTLHLNEDEPEEYYNKNSNKKKNRPKRPKQSHGRKNKKNKLWTLPKRPISAYNYFFQQERPKVMADYPDCAFGDIARIIGQRWGRLDPYSKAALDKLYQQDSLRYRREVELARQKREQEMKEVAYPVSPTHQQQIIKNKNNNALFLPVTPILEDHQRHHQYLREPPPPAALRAPISPMPHQIPPSPTVASRRLVTSASSLESELIQPELWAKQRDQPAPPVPAAAAMAVYSTDGLGEPYTLMTRRHDVEDVAHRLQQQGQHRQFTRDHPMIMEYPHDGYDNNCSNASTTTTATSSSSPPALMRRQQLLEPNAIVPLRHPLTGVLEYYRVDYRAYQMTQSEARQFLRSYGCHNSSSNDGSYGSSSNEVQLEKILSLQLQPPGRPVSSS
jgi:HMG (high mobility group) box